MINEQPFFILANPRSGSSLLRIICESHPGITVPPESGFMEWWYNKYKDWSVEDSKNDYKIEEFCENLKSSKKFETWNFNFKKFKEEIKVKSPKSYAEIIALVYITFGIENGKTNLIWGDKNNYYLHKTKIINQLYPKAKYIHLVRDGRDVATSYISLKKLNTSSKYAPNLVDEINDIAKEWDENNKKLLFFFKSIPEHRVLRIRYEDLLNNLFDECQKITTFLNVPFNASMLNYYKINKAQSLEPKETLDWKRKTLKKPDITNIGKYKTLLTEKEIVKFNTITKKTLKLFKYEC